MSKTSNKNKTIIIVLTCLSLFIIGTGCFMYYITCPVKFKPNLSDSNYFIAHATGSLKGYKYLNSKESLISSLENGYKYIEIDLQYTSDSSLVCVHNWEQFNKVTIPGICGQDSGLFIKVPSIDEFKTRRIYGEYTPLTVSDIIAIQEKYHFTIVTDLICNAKALDRYFKKENRNKVMVEAYTEEDYQKLKQSGYTPMLSIGCVNYLDCLSFIASHLINNKIEWIVVEQHSSMRSLRLLKKMFNLKIALYTVNSPIFFKWHLGSDIDLIYTDNWNLKTQISNYQDNSTH